MLSFRHRVLILHFGIDWEMLKGKKYQNYWNIFILVKMHWYKKWKVMDTKDTKI